MIMLINYLPHTASAGYWNVIGKWLCLEIRLKLIRLYIRENLHLSYGRLVRNSYVKALTNFTVKVVVSAITI
jgi:hypothetical protein